MNQKSKNNLYFRMNEVIVSPIDPSMALATLVPRGLYMV